MASVPCDADVHLHGQMCSNVSDASRIAPASFISSTDEKHTHAKASFPEMDDARADSSVTNAQLALQEAVLSQSLRFAGLVSDHTSRRV